MVRMMYGSVLVCCEGDGVCVMMMVSMLEDDGVCCEGMCVMLEDDGVCCE